MIADAFEEFYRSEYLPMVRLAFGLVDTPEAAEEITQDAFAKVFERWDRRWRIRADTCARRS